MIVKDKLTKEQQMALNNAVLIVKSGSHLYGLNNENSDEDYVGIFIPSEEYIYGLKTIRIVDCSIKSKLSNKKNSKDAVDITMYTIQEFFRLALANNPNIIEILYVPEDCIVEITPLGRKILENKNIFLSGEALTRFNGYAMTQRGKNFTKTKTYELLFTAKDYLNKNIKYLTFEALLEAEHENVSKIFSNINDKEVVRIGDLKLNKNITIKRMLFFIDERIAAATNRLEDMKKNGYDGKALSHSLRLQAEMLQFCNYGELRFPLVDYRDKIMATKTGKLTIDEILELSDKLDEEIKKVSENFKQRKNDYEAIHNLCVKLQKNFFYLMEGNND